MNVTQSVNSSLKSSLNQHDFASNRMLIVVGVSGGTDSLALLHVLVHLRDARTFDLHVATLDHGLRGDAGAADVRFVVEMAQAWRVPVTSGFTHVGALARDRGLSIEAAARAARYDFLAKVANDVGADCIAVAHNADDQVETVLLHLLRGSGITGLSGMASSVPMPGHPDLLLIRPLLDVPRADLDTYCRQHDLHPRHDASNDDQTYTRNRLRHDVIPHLRDLSPQLDRRLLQLAEIASLEDDFVTQSLIAAVEPRLTRAPDQVSLPRAVFADLHPALQRRFIMWALAQLHPNGEPADASSIHLRAAADLALTGQVGAVAQFPHGFQLRVGYDSIYVERTDSVSTLSDHPLLPAPDAEIAVSVPGVTAFGDRWQIAITSISSQERGELHRQQATAASSTKMFFSPPLPMERGAGGEVVLRSRRPNDRFTPLGMDGHTQKLAKWMIDHKAPRDLRDRLPLLVIDGQIAAIYWNRWFVSLHFSVTTSVDGAIYAILLQEQVKFRK